MAAELADRIGVGVFGASGYAGGELVRLLVRHPNVDIRVLTAERKAHSSYGAVFPHLASAKLPELVSINEVNWSDNDVDILFCALPHGQTQELISGLFGKNGRGDVVAGHKDMKVIDLSSDFRLAPQLYAQWYGKTHMAPALQNEAVYGLTEFAKGDIEGARLVSCPGCYPTATLLPLLPILKNQLIEADGIIIDAKSGVSGAGRTVSETNLFCEINDGIHAYAVGGHRHAPEIETQLTQVAGENVTVSFTPHLVPMNRGILSTIYVKLRGGTSADDLRRCLSDYYENETFVCVIPESGALATRHVRGSNYCLIGVEKDRLTGRAIILSVIDNLVKGAAGQAVHNMNLMSGLDETTGLEQKPLFP